MFLTTKVLELNHLFLNLLLILTLMNIKNRKKKKIMMNSLNFSQVKLLTTKKKFDTAINNYDEWYNGKRKDGTGYDKNLYYFKNFYFQ
jgi:hypothetical protein